MQKFYSFSLSVHCIVPSVYYLLLILLTFITYFFICIHMCAHIAFIPFTGKQSQWCGGAATAEEERLRAIAD